MEESIPAFDMEEAKKQSKQGTDIASETEAFQLIFYAGPNQRPFKRSESNLEKWRTRSVDNVCAHNTIAFI